MMDMKYAVVGFNSDGEEFVYVTAWKDVAMDFYNEHKDMQGECWLCEIKAGVVNE